MTGSPPTPGPAADLLSRVRACRSCTDLPLGPRPILQWSPSARLLIAGQAPGRVTHERGRPFDDASGERLRDWLGVTPAQFYDDACFAIIPMGFCFPGSGKSGDAPPRPECAPLWRDLLLAPLTSLELTIVIGRYAADWHFGARRGSLTDHVRDWRVEWPRRILLPHPSPRNNGWLARNQWFERDLLPELRARVAALMGAR